MPSGMTMGQVAVQDPVYTVRVVQYVNTASSIHEYFGEFITPHLRVYH